MLEAKVPTERKTAAPHRPPLLHQMRDSTNSSDAPS